MLEGFENLPPHFDFNSRQKLKLLSFLNDRSSN